MILYKEAMQEAIRLLSLASIENAPLDAFYLWSYITGKNRAWYLLHQTEHMTTKAYQQFLSLVKKRAEHTPLQYLTNEQEFMGLSFYVNENVLIPRQDTEILVEKVKDECKGKSVLDMCTGSGCIAISIGYYYAPSKVTAVDLSKNALEVAQKNAREHHVPIEFIQSNMFENVENTYDIIVSNPPYIKTDDIFSLMPEVSEHEPKMALDGEKDGLKFYKILAKEAVNYLNPDGMLCLEIGCDQADEVSALLLENGFHNINVTKDYAGLNRVISAKVIMEEKNV